MASTHHQPQTSKFPKCPKCSQPSEGHVSLSFGLGGGNYNDSVGNRDLKVTPFETDFLTAAHQSQHLYYLLSLHYFEPLQHTGWVSGFSVGPTVYYQPVHFSGEVYQFRQPILNNYTYRAKIHPINAYVEADLFLHALFHHHVRPFVFAGGGVSFIEQSYEEMVTPAALAIGVPAGSRLYANPKWDEVLAYELGAGIRVRLNAHWYLAGRYVYQDSSKAHLSIPGSLGSQRFDISGNSGYFVVGYEF